MKLTCVNYLLRADSFRRIHVLPLRVRRVIKCPPAVQLYCASGVHNFAQYLAEISQYLITITKRLRADKSANGLRLPLSEGVADGNTLRIPLSVHLALYFLKIRHFHKGLCPLHLGQLPGKGQIFGRLTYDGAWDGFNVAAR